MNCSNKKLPPLYYAIILHFLDGKADNAQGIVDALMSDYGHYKLLNLKDVEEALATAKENGLLEEADFLKNESGELVIDYRLTEFGRDMIRRYLL